MLLTADLTFTPWNCSNSAYPALSLICVDMLVALMSIKGYDQGFLARSDHLANLLLDLMRLLISTLLLLIS